jgi:hypothetical protein
MQLTYYSISISLENVQNKFKIWQPLIRAFATGDIYGEKFFLCLCLCFVTTLTCTSVQKVYIGNRICLTLRKNNYR